MDFIHVSTSEEDENSSRIPAINYRQYLGMLMGFMHFVAGGILSGYASIIIAQTNTDTSTITKSEVSWIVSISLVPMAPATIVCGFLLNKVRRKTVLIGITLLEIISWLITFFSTNITSILIGRFVNGIACSMGSPIVPPFLGEISHPNTRSFYLSLVLLGVSTGVLFIHVLGALYTWNMCALITAIFLMLYFGLVLHMPETYAWHLRHADKQSAEEAFYWYRGRNQSSKLELQKLFENQESQNNGNPSKSKMLRICVSRTMLMPLFITNVAMVTMHLSGVKVIMFYSITIVRQVIPSLNQYTSTIIVDVIRLCMTIIGSVLVNKFPIRPMFIISGVGSAISHFCFACFISYSDNSSSETNNIFSILALVALIVHTVFSFIGIAPLPWIIAGEIFPLAVKAIASGFCCFIYFGVFFIMVKVTPDFLDALGIAGGFIFFGCCTVLGTTIIYFILPETKNKTLMEIEELFQSKLNYN